MTPLSSSFSRSPGRRLFSISSLILLFCGAAAAASAADALQRATSFDGENEVPQPQERDLLHGLSLPIGGRPRSFTGSVTRFELINTLTNQVIANLTNGLVIAVNDIANMSTPSFNIRAQTSGTGTQAVIFGHNNRTNVRRESVAPWAFCGNSGSKYTTCRTLTLGTHVVTATPYSSRRTRSATKGSSMNVTFTIVQTKAPSAPIMASAPKAPSAPIAGSAPSAPTSGSAPTTASSPVAPTAPKASPSSPVVAAAPQSAVVPTPVAPSPMSAPVSPPVATSPMSAPTKTDTAPTPTAPATPVKAPTKAPATVPVVAPSPVAVTTPTVSSTFAPILINCGGEQYVDRNGRTWIKDQYFSGDDTSTYCNLGQAISNSFIDPVYQCERYGSHSYSIPVPAGSYEVNLLFAEIYLDSSGGRLFDAIVEGTKVLSNFDLYATVGKNVAYTKSTVVTVNDGFITIDLKTVKNNAKISGIEINRSGGAGGSPMNPPVPVKSPVTAPVPAPVPVPVPVKSPTNAPVSAPVPVKSPVSPPVSTTGVWINSPTPIIPRYQSCFVMVNNPTVGRRAYLVGGIGSNIDTEVYNPIDRSWSKAEKPPISLSHMNCVAAQGKLWIPAAWDGEKNTEFTYVYDPATNKWDSKKAMPVNRRRGSAAVMVSPDETKIYVSHGTNGGHEWNQNENKATSLPYLDVYDIASDTWSELSSSAPNVRDHAGGAVVGKYVCVAGGRHGGEYGFPAVEATDCFNLETKAWEVKPPLSPARSRAQYATTCDGKLMVAGGEYRGTTYNQVDIFDGNTWTKYTNLPNNGRHSGGLAVDCSCNQIHLVSGLVTSYGDAVDKSMSTYYPGGSKTECSSGSTNKDPVPPPAPTPASTPSGQCAVPRLGGDKWLDGRPYPLNVAEAQGMMIGTIFVVYGGFWKDWKIASSATHTLDTADPKATWQKVDDIPIKEGLTHGAHVHVGTKIYNCGGYVGGHPGLHTTKCIVYDQSKPLGQRWSEMASLPDGRGGGGMFHNSQLNTIYYVSGAQRYRKNSWIDTLDFNTVWGFALDNPSAGWVKKADLPYAANHMMAVTTKDGSGKERHYAFGGQYREDEPEGNYKEHYEYDALNDKWIKRNFMPYARAHATSSTHALGCGFIMVAGNTNGNKILSTVTYYSTETDSWTDIGNVPHELNTPICDINRNTNVMYCETGRLWTSRSYTRQLLL